MDVTFKIRYVPAFKYVQNKKNYAYIAAVSDINILKSLNMITHFVLLKYQLVLVVFYPCPPCPSNILYLPTLSQYYPAPTHLVLVVFCTSNSNILAAQDPNPSSRHNSW